MAQAIIAYIDILGGKKFISENPSAFFTNCQDLFCKTTEEMRSIINTQETTEIKNLTFSDNICIIVKVENDDVYFQRMKLLLNYVGILQQHALFCYGYTLRGGIAYGTIYSDDKLISGQPLIEAVTLEEKVAFYPRIILGDSAVKLLSAENQTWLKQHHLIHTEADSAMMVDFIGRLIYDLYSAKNAKSQNDSKIILEEISKKISDCLKNTPQGISIRLKWNWLAQYLIRSIREISSDAKLKSGNSESEK